MYIKIESKFEELMKSWCPDTEVDEVKRLPVFKGIVGQEEICGHSLVDVKIYEEWSKVMWTGTKQGYVRTAMSMRNRERLGNEYKDMKSRDYSLLHRIVCRVKKP